MEVYAEGEAARRSEKWVGAGRGRDKKNTHIVTRLVPPRSLGAGELQASMPLWGGKGRIRFNLTQHEASL